MKKYVITIIILLFSATYLSAKTIRITSSEDSGEGSLREAIENADPDDIIIFADDITTIYFSGVIILDKNITISGNNADNTVFQNGETWTDRVNKKRYFNILSGAEVTFNYLTLKDNTGYCKACAILNEGKLTLNNCTFSNNKSSLAGGAIESDGILNITNCTFINNNASISGGAITCSGEITIINSRFAENSCNSSGGAIFTYMNSNTTVTISNCIFEKNTSSYGGAISINSNATASISNCIFKKNTSSNGGAINIGSNTTASILNCIFEENTASYSGAICNYGTATINDCTFKKNKATYYGAIQNSNQISINNSDFYQNEAATNGIFGNTSSNGNATLVNCLFTNNTITYTYTNPSSHGIISAHSDAELLTLINCTVADNTDTGISYLRSNAVLYNTILWNNVSKFNDRYDVCKDIWNTNNGVFNAFNSLIGTSNIDLSDCGEDNIIGEDPLFIGNDDYSLQEESPAIDKGNNDYLPAEITKDLAGNPRISNVTVDMGAYEYQQEPITSLAKTSPNEQLKVYVRNRTVIIENAAEPVCIYNILGLPVAQGTKTEYTMPQAGVYMVKTGKMVKKVIINN